MQLAEQVLQAHGGGPLWRTMSRFTAHVSIGGALLPPPNGQPPTSPYVTVGGYRLAVPQSRPTVRGMVMEGETDRPFVRMFGTSHLDRYAIYTPGHTEFRNMSDRLIEAQDNPLAAMQNRSSLLAPGALDRVFLYGSLVWSAVVGPFVLECGATSEEIAPSQGSSHLRQLRIESPKSLDPLTPVRTLHIDSLGLARRAHFELRPFLQGPVADTLSAYGVFDGITMPTLRRLQALSPDGTIDATPLIDIEIFDVQFS